MRPAVAITLLCGIAAAVHAAPGVVDAHLKVDQFGYRPAATKIAVLSDPQVGWNAPDPYSPGATIEVRRWGNDTVAWSGTAAAWSGGATHGQSGDRVWWVDFSSLTEVGPFYLYDPANAVGSVRFEIGDSVYDAVLEATVRSLFYQRCGTPKTAAHAGASWADTACHVGAQQDTDCRWVLDTSAATSKDLSGGWHDAGDYNKYVNFSDGPIHDLLLAYEDNPTVWRDDYAIPESGNGVPDLLDEVKWELDWLLKMQLADGSVLHKVSVTNFNAASPPSGDSEPRRYAEATASATISACGAFAHGAIVYSAQPDPTMQAYGATLRAAALAAWAWLEANPGSIPSSYNNAGFQNVDAEDGAYEQGVNRTCAAVYLHALTGSATYRAYVDANYANSDLIQWGYAYPFEAEYQDGLLYYGRASGATGSVVSAIQSAYAGSVVADHLAPHTSELDAYMAYLPDSWYVWGSNRVKAEMGFMFLAMNRYGLDPGNAARYTEIAERYVHYMHGVNPMGLTYLSNMAAYGAEGSIQEFYHSWFFDGTVWDNATTSLYGPAPGFVPGGANPAFQPDPSYTGPPIEPPMNQPHQKSYRDWNTSWPENSWEVTENGIYYQASFVRLLSAFASAGGSSTGKEDVVAGAGLGQPNPNRVRVFDGGGSPTTVDFNAYAAGGWGVNVAAGDLDGGASPEVLTGPGPGAVFGPQVRAFTRTGTAMGKVNFYAYGTLRFGVNAAGGPTDGDAYAEILSGAGPGAVFGPHVRGFDFDATAVSPIAKINFFAYGTLKYGVNVATGDLEGDGYAELVTGPGPGVVFGPQVRGFNQDGGPLTSIAKVNFVPPFAAAQYGANVATGDVDDDGFAEILATPGPGVGASFPSRFMGFDYDGAAVAAIAGFDVTPYATRYGGRLGSGDVGGGAAADLLAAPGRDPAATSDVRGYSYQGGTLALLPGSFVAFSGSFYGANVAGADLGY